MSLLHGSCGLRSSRSPRWRSVLIGPAQSLDDLDALAAIMLATSAAGYCPLYSLARPSGRHRRTVAP